jgi:hypothetical protein
VLQQANLNRSSPTQLTKPDDESQSNEMFVSFQDLPDSLENEFHLPSFISKSF